MSNKVHPDEILILEDSCKIKEKYISKEEIYKLFLGLSTNDFLEVLNLSVRSYNLLIKNLNLHRPRNKTKTELFMESIVNKDEFETNYRTLSKTSLLTLYNTTEAILKSAANKLGITLTKEEILNKVKLANLEKYGVEWYSSTSEWNHRRKETNLLKYGDENYNNIEKSKQTCLERYGETNANKCAETKEKIKRTNLEKYGVENYYESDDFKIKSAKTKIEKYGNAKYTNHNKAEETCIKKYGVNNPNKCESVKIKRAKTNLDKYGVENVFSNQEIKNKIKNTIEEKYGVPYACMTEQCRNAATLEDSSANIKFKTLLEKANIKYSREFSLKNYSYDFKVENFLIEINPTATHNSTWGWRGNKETGLDKYYHYNKSKTANDSGYQCLCVWDWDDMTKIIELLKPKPTINADKCEIKLVSSVDTEKFLNNYHLQGYTQADIQIGLYFNTELVSIMTFKKFNQDKKYQYELLRYCSSINVVDGAKKLFSYFIKNYKPTLIVSYCDVSKFSGKTQDLLNFTKLTNKIIPAKHWVHPYYKKHITDDFLCQQGFNKIFNTTFDSSLDDTKLMLNAGFVEVYDCGQVTYIYRKEDKNTEC